MAYALSAGKHKFRLFQKQIKPECSRVGLRFREISQPTDALHGECNLWWDPASRSLLSQRVPGSHSNTMDCAITVVTAHFCKGFVMVWVLVWRSPTKPDRGEVVKFKGRGDQKTLSETGGGTLVLA